MRFVQFLFFKHALAYVIDSTGAPVCVLLPFSTWAIFFAGIFWEQSEIVDLGYGSAMATYIHAIPYMFYALVALIIVPLFISFTSDCKERALDV